VAPPDRADFESLLIVGSEAIGRANLAASTVLTVIGALNVANAAFLRAPSMRYLVEQRLARAYLDQCEPLEQAAEDLEREVAIIAPCHRQIVRRLRADTDLAPLAASYLASLAKLSAAAVIGSAELARFPDALDRFGERLELVRPATSRLAPAARRVLVALTPAAGWGERVPAADPRPSR
jgi:hypothetical protein